MTVGGVDRALRPGRPARRLRPVHHRLLRDRVRRIDRPGECADDHRELLRSVSELRPALPRARGSDLLVRRMRERLPRGTVTTGMPLRAIRRRGNGYRCTFGGTEAQADVVVLALPFSALRDVDYRGAGIGPLMNTAIHRLGMGENSKLNFQFRRPVWEPHSSGDSLSDLVLGSTWPGQLGQRGPQGIAVMLNGAPLSVSYGKAPAHGKASSAVVAQTLAALERVFPGARQAFIPGQAYLDYWPADPYVKGSYAYYKTGGLTTFGGDRVRAAGEHRHGRRAHRADLAQRSDERRRPLGRARRATGSRSPAAVARPPARSRRRARRTSGRPRSSDGCSRPCGSRVPRPRRRCRRRGRRSGAGRRP